MDYNETEVKAIIDKYIKFVDNLEYNYEDKIKNLLYLIVPAFIIRYKLDNERLISKTFENVPIIKLDKEDKENPAFYVGKPVKENNIINIQKVIVIKDKSEDMVNLLDSLVHEYNHAVNSYNNPFTVKEDKIYVRTGLANIIYDKNTLEVLDKEKSFILEEVLNTVQTEQIINIIHSFKKYNFTNPKINTALYILDNHIKEKFDSEAYYLEKFFSEELIKNKTFTSTLTNLRINGYIEDIEYWFNNITGIKNSYNEFIENMIKLHEMKKTNFKFKFQERRFMNKIKELYKEEKYIIEVFNKNSN